MSSGRMFLAGGVAACALAALVFWLWPGAPVTSSQPSGIASEPPRGAAPAAASAPLPTPRAPEAADPQLPAVDQAEPEPSAEDHAQEAHEGISRPTADLLLYAGKPMSAVPHRVLRAWGASDDDARLGLVGAYVIVEPGMSDENLLELCRDIQAYHRSADALSVQILDSEDAATYNRHIDGGERLNQHLMATVNHDAKLGVKVVRVRGKVVEP